MSIRELVDQAVKTGDSLGYTFEVPGRVVGKGRPRFGNGRVFTDANTERAENRILYAWKNEGRYRIDDGPVSVSITAVLPRPRAHIRKVGGLNAAGLRSTHPTKRPDVDNILKIALDALNGQAWRDDAQVVAARVGKRWAGPGEAEHLLVTIREETP